MTLTIELTPEEIDRLKREAALRGVDVTQYARQRLGLVETVRSSVTMEEWEADMRALAEGSDRLPVLKTFEREK